MSHRSSLWLCGLVVAACGGAPPRDVSNVSLSSTQAEVAHNTHAITQVQPTERVLELLQAPDRLAEDRALDQHNRPRSSSPSWASPPGMRVAELGCGGGYTTELLARAVGSTGIVYGQNANLHDASIERAWAARLARPANAHVVRVDRNFSAPLPEQARGLDLVDLAVDYRSIPLGVDADAMNHAVHLALRRGGRYVVLDRTPPEGARLADLRALHTQESRGARREIEAAGFSFVSEGRFFRDARDPRDWDAIPGEKRTGEKPDRFVLVFVRPYIGDRRSRMSPMGGVSRRCRLGHSTLAQVRGRRERGGAGAVQTDDQHADAPRGQRLGEDRGRLLLGRDHRVADHAQRREGVEDRFVAKALARRRVRGARQEVPNQRRSARARGVDDHEDRAASLRRAEREEPAGDGRERVLEERPRLA